MKQKTRLIALILLAGICIFVIPLLAQQISNPAALERGIGLYKHENLDEALPVLKKARQENPQSSLAAYYLGLTYKQLQDYDSAITNLKDAVTLTPKISGALMELIDCYNRLDKLEDAKAMIAEAERENVRPGQTEYFKGLILAKENDTNGALDSFKRAMELDKSSTQAAKYQIGLINLKKGDFRAAQEAFQDVRNIVPSSNLANFAQQYLDALGKRAQPKKPFKFTFNTAWQYDDNVVLKPEDASLALDIANKSDSRHVYSASAEYNHAINSQMSLRSQYLFYYSKQNDLGFYDTMSHTIEVQPGFTFKDGFLSFPLGYNYTFVDDRSYLSSPYASSIYNFMMKKNQMIQLYAKYQNKNYFWAPSTQDENRNGNDAETGAGWYLFYAKNKGFVNVHYGLNKEWTDGNNWQYLGNRASLSALIPVMDRLNVTLAGDFYKQDFENVHSIYNLHRRDKTSTYSSLISYKLHKDWEVQLQYTHIRDNSNIGIYTYTRNIYSAGLQYIF